MVQQFLFKDLPAEARIGYLTATLQLLSDHNGAWLWRAYVNLFGKTKNAMVRKFYSGDPEGDKVMYTPHSYNKDFLKGFLEDVDHLRGPMTLPHYVNDRPALTSIGSYAFAGGGALRSPLCGGRTEGWSFTSIEKKKSSTGIRTRSPRGIHLVLPTRCGSIPHDPLVSVQPG